MAIKMQRCLLSTIALLLILSGSSKSQIIFGQASSASTGFVYTKWELTSSDASQNIEITQSWVPVSGFIALKDNLEARYYIANSNNELTSGSSKTELKGIGDLRIQIARSFSDDQILLSGGINLPTGKTELDFSVEREVVDLLSQSFLEFPMRRFGEGFGFDLTVGAAKTFGNLVLGSGISYDYIGKYSPYKGVDNYDLGDLMSFEIGLNINKSATAYSLNIKLSANLPDKLDGQKVFKQGQVMSITGAGLLDNKEYRLSGSARYSVRGRSTRYVSNSDEVRDRLKLYGNEIFLNITVGRYFGSSWFFSPTLSYLNIDSNEDQLGKSNMIKIGATISNSLGEKTKIALRVNSMNGEADAGNLDLSGFQLSLSLLNQF